jgi:large subunit ribosomal protein L11
MRVGYMGKQTVDAMVKGGEASAAPPLGPALGPLGVNIPDVIKQINDKTSAFRGMEVPVKIIVDDSKKVTITVGTPPVSSLLKKELGKQKLARVTEAGKELPGDIKFEKIVQIAKGKDSITGKTLKAKVKQVLGTCLSGGVTVDGRNPRDLQKDIDEGKLKVE